jgi:low temperature requirement protein LtrA
VISTSSDPGRLARGYHELHPVMVAGIIVIAAADELVLRHPLHCAPATTWTVLGGSALFIGGHALFKGYVWRSRPWSRIVAVLVLIALLPVGAHIAPIALAGCALAVTVGVCVSDALFAPTD